MSKNSTQWITQPMSTFGYNKIMKVKKQKMNVVKKAQTQAYLVG